jgi:hypothetical protein
VGRIRTQCNNSRDAGPGAIKGQEGQCDHEGQSVKNSEPRHFDGKLINHYFYVEIGTTERKQLEISFIFYFILN